MSSSVFPYRVWIPLIVFTVAFGGIVAFYLARPDQRSNTPISIDGAWGHLSAQRIGATLSAMTERLDIQVQKESALREAARAARAWSGTLPAGSATRSQLETSYSPDVTQNPARLASWASGLPITLTSTRQSGDATLVGTGANALVRVPLVMSITLRQATRKRHVFRVPIDVTLRPQLPLGEEDLTTATWKVQDASTSQQRGLRAIDQPIIVQRENVDLIIDADHRDVAVTIADEAQESMQVLATRYSRVNGPSVAAIFLLDSEDQAAKVLGSSSRRPSGVEPSGWTWENGDIVLLTQRESTSYIGTVRHEMTHLVTLPMLRSGNVATMLLEGVAVNEEARRVITSDSNRYIGLSSLRDAFRKGTLGYDQLLRSRESFFGRSSKSDVDLAYLAGFATVRYLEDTYSHDAVEQALIALSNGNSIDRVLTTSFKLTPAVLQKRVRVWTANYERTHAASDGSSKKKRK